MPISSQVEIPFSRSYDIGIGVVQSSGEGLVKSVEGAATGVEGATGGFGTFDVMQISSTSELETELGISADVKAGIGLFKGSDKFEFSKKCKLQTYSLVLLIKGKRTLGFTQVDEPMLTAAAAALATSSPAAFAERFGDCFVRGITRGGQFFGLIRIDVNSQESRQTIQNSLSGSIGTFSADVVLKLNEAMKATQSRAVVHVYHEGGNIGGVVPSTPEQLIAAAGFWNTSIAADAFPLTVILAPYSLAGGPRPPNEIDLEHQKDILMRCARLRTITNDALNQVEYVLEHIQDFKAVDAVALNALRSSLATDLDIVAQAASFALENPKAALEPESFARQIKLMPEYKLTQIGVMPQLLDHAPMPFEAHSLVGALWDKIEEIQQARPTSQAEAAFISNGAADAGGGLFLTDDEIAFFTDQRIEFILKAKLEISNQETFSQQGRFEVAGQFPESGMITADQVVSIRVINLFPPE